FVVFEGGQPLFPAHELVPYRLTDQVNPQAILVARPLRANTKNSASHSRRGWLTGPARTASNRIDTTKKTFISILYNQFLSAITERIPSRCSHSSATAVAEKSQALSF